MKNTINNLKSLAFVAVPTLLITVCFQTNVIKTNVNRSPAVVKEVKEIKTLKSNIKAYLLAVNNIH